MKGEVSGWLRVRRPWVALAYQRGVSAESLSRAGYGGDAQGEGQQVQRPEMGQNFAHIPGLARSE